MASVTELREAQRSPAARKADRPTTLQPKSNAAATDSIRVVRVIARLNLGGPAKHVVWLTAGLTDQGFTTRLVTGVVPHGEADMTYFAGQHGVNPHLIPQMSRELSWKDLYVIWQFYRLFKRERPHIIHTHTAKAGTVGRLAALAYRWFTPSALVGRPRRCQVLHTFHGHIFHSYYGRWKTRLFLAIERFLATAATHCIVVISPQQRREIRDHFGVGRRTRFAVVLLDIDMPTTSSASSRDQRRAELRIDPETVAVAIVGRLAEVKNHRMFLEAAATYANRFSRAFPCRFFIVGDGHLRRELERTASQLNLRHHCVFLGARHDAPALYPVFDIIGQTSLNEGTPVAIIEAMLSLRAAISTAVGGVVDVLGQAVSRNGHGFTIHERGLSVQSRDVNGFASALRELAANQALRHQLADAGYQFARRHYSKDRLLRDMKQPYDELLHRHDTMRSNHARLNHRWGGIHRVSSGRPIHCPRR